MNRLKLKFSFYLLKDTIFLRYKYQLLVIDLTSTCIQKLVWHFVL